MALDAAALSDYTQGRLASGDATTKILNRALAAARRYCGWHVSPVLTQTIVIDGPGGLLLQLPTLNVTALTSVAEDGVAVTLSGLEWSRTGQVRKLNNTGWTSKFGGLTVALSHGYDDVAAADFEQAVLSIADRMSDPSGEPISVGPFRWGESKTETSGFDATELSILQHYRLERRA